MKRTTTGAGTSRRRIAAAFGTALLAAASIGAQDSGPFLIGPEDVLSISVWENEAISSTVPVRPDGYIALPLLGDVEAAGKTPAQLAESIEARLGEYMPRAEVAVLVTEVNSFKVSVVGHVNAPSRYVLRSPTTVLDALALAGGLDEFADAGSIVVLRPTPIDGSGTGVRFQRLRFDYKKVLRSGGETENFRLQPDDIVVVP